LIEITYTTTGRWERIWESMIHQMPLTDMTNILAVAISNRVSMHGRNYAGGMFSAYKRNTTGATNKRGQPLLIDKKKPWFWANPSMVGAHGLPEKNVILKAGDGRWAYPAYGDFKDALRGSKQKKNFKLTDKLWSNMRIKNVKPGHTRLMFYGQRRAGGKYGKNPSNNALATILESKEKVPILMPSKAEAKEAIRFLESKINKQWLEELHTNRRLFTIDKKFSSLHKKVDKVSGMTRAGFPI
jgi:hypothetical protein